MVPDYYIEIQGNSKNMSDLPGLNPEQVADWLQEADPPLKGARGM